MANDQRIPDKPLYPAPPDDAWNETFGKNVWWSSYGFDKGCSMYFDATSENGEKAAAAWEKFKTLHELLLRIGGNETCFAHTLEPDMDDILSRGCFFDGKSRMVRGAHNQCHYNASRLFEKSLPSGSIAICTGYALSTDGMWRQHSWNYETYTNSQGLEKHRILESTAKRVAYFGYIMTIDEAKAFALKN